MDINGPERRTRPPGMRFSEWRAPDGWTIRRMDWPQPDSAATRGTLVFAGGRADFIEKYLEPLAHWHRRGWTVVSFDWRGQGHSRGEIVGGNFTDFDPLVADAAALIAEVVASAPGPHVAIMHSMGGHILLRVLAEHRPALAAAVLVAPMLAINTAPTPPWLGTRLARWLCRLGLTHSRAWRESGPISPSGRIRQKNLTGCDQRFADELWWKGQEPGFHLGPPSWGWLNAGFRSTARHDQATLARLHTPVLLLGTERDRLVSPQAIRRAARLLPHAELRMYDDAAHELLREIDPIRLDAIAAIDAFLDRHAAR